MDKQNSKGHNDPICSTKATLNYASTLKVDVQNQVYLLTQTLKKVEHELCMQIDRQCRAKLQGLEYLCENDKCVAGCQNLNAKCNGDGDDGFPKKSKLEKDFKTCMRLLQNYGQTRKFDFSKIMSWGSQVNKGDSPKEQVDTKENVHGARSRDEDSEELFEFVDSVECLSQGQSMEQKIRTLLTNDSNNSSEKLDDSEEALEKASCSSVDSFDVIPNECSVKGSVCTATPTLLPGIVQLPKMPKAGCCKDKPRRPQFFLPNPPEKEPTVPSWVSHERVPFHNQAREDGRRYSFSEKSPNLPEKKPGVLSRGMYQGNPLYIQLREDGRSCSFSPKSPAEESILKPNGGDKILAYTSKVTVAEAGQETVIPRRNLKLNIDGSGAKFIADFEKLLKPTENTSPVKQSAVSQDENNPANVLQDSFKSYLQKEDLKAWVHPNSEPKANRYDNWVFKPAVPSSPKPPMGFVTNSLSKESACASEAVSSAFYRQLKAFVA